MTGHIRRRGERSWELKFDNGRDPLTGKRSTKYHSFKGTKREAEAELVRLKAAANAGDYVDPVRTTLNEYLDRWETWAVTQVGRKTLERYRGLLARHVRPHLGGARMQHLKPIAFGELYGKLQKARPDGAGLAARTVGHVHRLLHRVFEQAIEWSVVTINPVTAKPPRVHEQEVAILKPEQIPVVLAALRERTLYPVTVLALATGMRRGELVALRWGDVDLDSGKLRVERSLEQTAAGLAFKPPKSKAGRRTVSIPASVVVELRRHWREQQELRLRVGLGKSSLEDLVFPRPDGSAWPPDRLSSTWAKTVAVLELPKVTFHALRHTHASQLIAAGLDVVTVSRRIGHSNPTITLSIYAHLFSNTDERAAAIVEDALAGSLGT